jgi:hypothetical protein
MNYYSRLRFNLFLLRNGCLQRIFGRRAFLRLVELSTHNCDASIPLILSQLVTSQSPRFSHRLLLLLSSIPVNVLETNKIAKGYFLSPDLGQDSVERAIRLCQASLRKCFRGGRAP